MPELLGEPALEFKSLQGQERLSTLYAYHLELQTPDSPHISEQASANVDYKSLVGKELSVAIELDGSGTFISGLAGHAGGNRGAGLRHIAGIVTQARYVRTEHRRSVYAVVLEPWLTLATRTSDYKIFQYKSVTDILREVLSDYGYSSEIRTSQPYPRLVYQVQYGETDERFIARLMAEWGLYYYFEHSAQHNELATHRLIIVDGAGAHQPNPSSAYHQLNYYPPSQRIDEEFIHHYTNSEDLQSGQWVSRDFDFEHPNADLQITSAMPRNTGHAQLERFHYPGDYDLPAQAKGGDAGASTANKANTAQDVTDNAESAGALLARVRMQALGVQGITGQGEGHLRGLCAGHTFSLARHPVQAFNQDYLLTSTTLHIRERKPSSQGPAKTPYEVFMSRDDFGEHYTVECSFTTIPAINQFRAPWPLDSLGRLYKPRVDGTESAIVTGPAERNLWTDQYGRVKVQFPWDRYGKRNENSSCWIRVACIWSGGQLGQTAIPRIGQEVLVSYTHGDPDRPVIVGSMNNALNMAAFDLPHQSALTAIRSRELVEGGGNATAGRSNHVVLDDTAHKIQVQIKSDHLHTQVGLGYNKRIEDNDGNKEYRGEGFEARSDGPGAVRTKGLLLTAHVRIAARGHMLSMDETLQELGQGLVEHRNMGDLAVHHQAHEDSEAQAVQKSLQQQNDELAGTGPAQRKDTGKDSGQGGDHFPEMQAPHITLSSPAGIQSSTAGSTHQASQAHHAVTAGKHISLAAVGSLLSSAGKHLSAFANLSLRLIAAKGKVQIQAQDNDMQLLAQKVVEIIGKEGINLKSEQRIRLAVGPHALQLTPDKGLEFISPVSAKFHTGPLALQGPQSLTQAIQSSPQSRFNEKIRMVNDDGVPFANWKYQITRSDGSIIQGVTDSKGYITLLRHDIPEKCNIELLGSAT
jgi:type VI secretion system secreted protein VgrG